MGVDAVWLETWPEDFIDARIQGFSEFGYLLNCPSSCPIPSLNFILSHMLGAYSMFFEDLLA